MSSEPPIERDVPLAPFTTLELGGPARMLVSADDERTIVDAVRWANEHEVRLVPLGAASNVVVADRGLDALVLRIATRGIELRRDGDDVLATAMAGEVWDAFVEHAVAGGLAGIECLSGIPGLVGATPIQNVGAYGQEVSQTIRSVRVLDRATLEIRHLTRAECGFSYRDSAFRRAPELAIVLDVTFALRPGGAASLRYDELSRALGAAAEAPSLELVRDTVLALRRKKSMVIEQFDENRRSVGSFFTNPIVSVEVANDVVARAIAARAASADSEVPRWPQADGRVKLAAAWLIEHAGIHKGFRADHVGVSTRHALALVHHGGGTSTELIALARHVRAAVVEHFGIRLEPEPILLGFDPADAL